MFWKKKEDKLVKGAEENSASMNIQENEEDNAEVLGMALKDSVIETLEEENEETGSFASSTLGAMSIKPVKKENVFPKREVVVNIGSKWQNFKGPIVIVKAIATHTENYEKLVIYEHNGSLWACPYDNFVSSEDITKRKDNKTYQKYRFEEIK